MSRTNSKPARRFYMVKTNYLAPHYGIAATKRDFLRHALPTGARIVPVEVRELPHVPRTT